MYIYLDMCINGNIYVYGTCNALFNMLYQLVCDITKM